MPRVRKTSRRAVAQAGVRIARRRGTDAVTVRAVAAALDVTPMALYHHVGSVDGLRDAVVDQILLDARVGMHVEGDTAAARLRTFAGEARVALARYPGAAARLLAAWPRLDQGCRVMEWLLSTTAATTRSAAADVAIARRVFTFVATSVVVDEARACARRPEPWPVVDAHPERFPRLCASRASLQRFDADQEFEAGLETLLASAGLGVTSG